MSLDNVALLCKRSSRIIHIDTQHSSQIILMFFNKTNRIDFFYLGKNLLMYSQLHNLYIPFFYTIQTVQGKVSQQNYVVKWDYLYTYSCSRRKYNFSLIFLLYNSSNNFNSKHAHIINFE